MIDLLAAELDRLCPPTRTDRTIVPAVRVIQEAICRRERVSLSDMLSPRRTKHLALARHIAIWLTRETTLLSLPSIGRMFGNRDHTSILYACSRINELMIRSSMFHQEMMAMRLALTTGRAV